MTDLLLKDYQPQPKLVVRATDIVKPRYSVIDVHNHIGEISGSDWVNRPVAELVDVLDEAGVKCLVDLDGGWEELHASPDWHFLSPGFPKPVWVGELVIGHHSLFFLL